MINDDPPNHLPSHPSSDSSIGGASDNRPTPSNRTVPPDDPTSLVRHNSPSTPSGPEGIDGIVEDQRSNGMDGRGVASVPVRDPPSPTVRALVPATSNPSVLRLSPSLTVRIFRTGALAAYGPAPILPSWEISPVFLRGRSRWISLGGSLVFSMVDSSINSPDVDPEAYPSLLETIQGLGTGYRSFNESSSNFPRFPGMPVIPGIHIPLQSDDSAVRGSQIARGTFPCQTAGADDPGNLAEQMAAGAQAGTSTSSADPLNTSEAGGLDAPPRPPRDIDTIPPLPSGLGPMPYNHFYGDGPGGFTEQFREKYSIPDDVLVERVSTDRVTFGEDFIVLPLFAITEGGVRFPLSPFLRYFLSDYKLAPIQVAVNTWRILNSAIRLAESNNLPFTLGDLMLMYMVSRNPKYDKYYLTTRQYFDHLVDRLYDTEKWGNVLVKVSGNFEWGPINPLLDYPFPTRTGSAIERPYRIPRVRGSPGSGDKPGTLLLHLPCMFLDFCVILNILLADCSAPNKGLFVTGKWSNLIALLQCPNRDAPTLLDYAPTYAGFAHRKDKSKMVRKTVDLATAAGKALQQQYQAQDLSTSGLPERKEQTEPIPSSQQEKQKQPSARTESQPIRRRETDPAAEGEDQRSTKKAKTAADVEVLSTRRSEDNPDEPSEAFVPDFTCSDGHVIAADDSLEESPLLAMTLLKGLALPKDMENLQTGKANNMAELCLFLAKAGQCASKAFADMHALLDTKRSMRVDLQAKRKEADQLADRLEELEAQVAESESVRQERDRLLLQLKDAEEENTQLKMEKQQAEEELPKKLEEAGDAGYNEAGEYYQEQVQHLVTKAFREGELKGMKDTHHSSFLRGYQVGLDYAEVPKVDHRREPPVVPPMELPETLPHEEVPSPTTDSHPDLADVANN
ncbi:hypothetical protein RHSIM_Rhsim13G0002100 [Rhododendron simsii]|uniref:Uncharacterized protein n=1 Tax=Rhododendron simsii TaxID=118357 RepID=A0A834G5P5_RHOSS|nr:hypothetical protein RHSIM_Rhsim13G0002100 [Rhododendron simsii]